MSALRIGILVWRRLVFCFVKFTICVGIRLWRRSLFCFVSSGSLAAHVTKLRTAIAFLKRVVSSIRWRSGEGALGALGDYIFKSEQGLT